MVRCPRCRTGLTLPLAAASELGSLYPETYSPYALPSSSLARLASTAIRRWQAFIGLRGAPLAALRHRPPERILDVGCGRGDLGAELIERGWSVTGIEPSAAACEVAAARGIDVRQGTLDDAELEPGAYAAVSFRHSLEHVVDPVADLATVRRALAPGGLALVTVPAFDSGQARRFRSRWYHLDLPRHRTHFTRLGLVEAFTRAGLQPVELTGSTSVEGLPASVQYALVGHCLFPSGTALRLAVAASAALLPVTRLAGPDVLHGVARRPAMSAASAFASAG